LNKKQEALRRGLRSFIEDTSKELADLEGRPLGPFPEAGADKETGVVSDAIVDAGAERADPPRLEMQAGAEAAPEPPAPPARTLAEPGALPVADPPKATHGTGSAVLGPQVPVTRAPVTGPQAPPPPVQPASSAVRREEPPASSLKAPASGEQKLQHDRHAAVPEPPAHHPSEVSAAPAHVAKPKRRAQAPVRRRPRPAAEIGANGVSPAQVHARKGVCFAYFLNHECWRVADAYCNSALQVCITRECPVYHLHKDALEHRFAKKFKHFW